MNKAESITPYNLTEESGKCHSEEFCANCNEYESFANLATYPEDPELVKALCRQAGYVLQRTNVPERVKVLVDAFPYTSSIAFAFGMWHILHHENNAGPFHKDRIMFSAWNALGHYMDAGIHLEPFPFEEFLSHSRFIKELEYCFALGMMYESDYLYKTDYMSSLLSRLNQEYLEFPNDMDYDFLPNLSVERLQRLIKKYEEEIQTFRFAVDRVPGLIYEKKRAMEFCLNLIKQK